MHYSFILFYAGICFMFAIVAMLVGQVFYSSNGPCCTSSFSCQTAYFPQLFEGSQTSEVIYIHV